MYIIPISKQLSELDTITNNLRKRLYRPSRGSPQCDQETSPALVNPPTATDEPAITGELCQLVCY